MSHSRIRNILNGALYDYSQSLPVDEQFHIEFNGVPNDVVANKPFVKTHCLPVDTSDETLSGDIISFHGLFRIDILSRWFAGSDTSYNDELAEKLFRLFRVNKMFYELDDDDNVVFETQIIKPLHTLPSRKPTDGKDFVDWWVTPCNIEYVSNVSFPIQ